MKFYSGVVANGDHYPNPATKYYAAIYEVVYLSSLVLSQTYIY